MQEQEVLFYRNMLNAVNDDKHFPNLVKYAKIQYDKANNALKVCRDPIDIHRLQGELAAYEKIINLKDFVLSVLRSTGA